MAEGIPSQQNEIRARLEDLFEPYLKDRRQIPNADLETLARRGVKEFASLIVRTVDYIRALDHIRSTIAPLQNKSRSTGRRKRGRPQNNLVEAVTPQITMIFETVTGRKLLQPALKPDGARGLKPLVRKVFDILKIEHDANAAVESLKKKLIAEKRARKQRVTKRSF